MTNFQIYPAIDLRNGEVVRLKLGDPNQQTTYSANPGSMADQWIGQGAEWLHVVNLDGAFGDTNSPNLAAVADIASRGTPVQFGGGLRTLADIDRVIDQGVSRVVIGTAAVKNPALVDAALAKHGADKIAVGIDSRDGIVRTHGWQEASGIKTLDLAAKMVAQGVQWTIFTDIARDGVGTGLNLEATVELAQESGLNVIASGGVHTAADANGARDAGLAGCIIGRALYEGTIAHLSEVL